MCTHAAAAATAAAYTVRRLTAIAVTITPSRAKVGRATELLVSSLLRQRQQGSQRP